MPGRSTYASILNDRGKFVDDCIICRLSVNSWMVVHGTGTGMEQLTSVAEGKNCAVIFDDDLHDLSLQGPVAVEFLSQHVAGLRDLGYFGIVQTTLFGCPVMISRTGYTGEREYEIFCQAKDAIHIWDSILQSGRNLGIVPVQFSTLDLLRTESYLLFYPGDNSETYPFDSETCGDTLWELGLDFTVSPGKQALSVPKTTTRPKGGSDSRSMGFALKGRNLRTKVQTCSMKEKRSVLSPTDSIPR